MYRLPTGTIVYDSRSAHDMIEVARRFHESRLRHSPLVVNIPHSSTFIPEKFRDTFLVDYLADELRIMTDWYTNNLFSHRYAKEVVADVSRLVVDMERFWDDDEESLSKIGMGAVYSRTSRGDCLIKDVEARKEEVQPYYCDYHRALEEAVDDALERTGMALILDCQSFSSRPLPHEEDKSYPRPDFCIGRDSFHTSPKLAGFIYSYFSEKGYSCAYDVPFSGSIVPLKHYKKDRRVSSVMIEVNRSLYMDEETCEKTEGFRHINEDLARLLRILENYRE